MGDSNANAPTKANYRCWAIRQAGGSFFSNHHRKDLANGKRQIWWDKGTQSKDAPLYLSETVRERDHSDSLLLCEGEPDTDALVDKGFYALGTVTGASTPPSDEALSVLHGRAVALWPDADPETTNPPFAGQRHMDEIAGRLRDRDCDVLLVEWADAPQDGAGAKDYFEAGHSARDFAELLSNAESYPTDGIAPALESQLEANGVPERDTSETHRDDGHLTVVPPASTYPLSMLPSTFLAYVREASVAIGVDPAMVAIPLLMNAAATIGNRASLELKPGYILFPTLWGVVVAPPGSAKTPAQMAASQPMVTLQREAKQLYDEQLANWEAETAEWESTDRADRDAKPERPVMEHFFTTDATIEALGSIVDTNPGVVLQRDEIVGWVTGIDAYRKGGERQQHLSMWAGTAAHGY